MYDCRPYVTGSGRVWGENYADVAGSGVTVMGQEPKSQGRAVSVGDFCPHAML